MDNKILIIGTGGGLTSEKHTDGYQYIEPLTRTYIDQHCSIEAAYDVLELFREDSINITPAMWQTLADVIYRNYAEYAAFIVVHGTDTMAYTAAALSLFFQNLAKPVILIGGSYSLSAINPFGRCQLRDSIRVALDSATPPAVFAISDRTVVAGTQLSNAADFTGTILPADGIPAARIKKEQIVWKKPSISVPSPKELKYLPTLDTLIAVQAVFPGFDPSLLFQTLLVSKPHGFILRGYGTGCVPLHGDHSLLPFLREARESDIPVVICSGATAGTTYLASFESGLPALSHDVIEAHHMTYEMTVVKLMWTLGQTRDMAQIAQGMRQDIAGELMPLPISASS